MTNEEIDALQPDRDLDYMIHGLVFRKRVIFKEGEVIGSYQDGDGNRVEMYSKDIYYDPDDTTQYLHMTDGFTGMIPLYSTSIFDAWRVVEYLRDKLPWPDGFSLSQGYIGAGWMNLCAMPSKYAACFDEAYGCETFSKGDTPSEAICKAALKAVNYESGRV